MAYSKTLSYYAQLYSSKISMMFKFGSRNQHLGWKNFVHNCKRTFNMEYDCPFLVMSHNLTSLRMVFFSSSACCQSDAWSQICERIYLLFQCIHIFHCRINRSNRYNEILDDRKVIKDFFFNNYLIDFHSDLSLLDARLKRNFQRTHNRLACRQIHPLRQERP